MIAPLHNESVAAPSAAEKNGAVRREVAAQVPMVLVTAKLKAIVHILVMTPHPTQNNCSRQKTAAQTGVRSAHTCQSRRFCNCKTSILGSVQSGKHCTTSHSRVLEITSNCGQLDTSCQELWTRRPLIDVQAGGSTLVQPMPGYHPLLEETR